MWQGRLPSQTRMAPEAGQNTAFKQIGSASNQESILCLVQSVYQGCTSIGQTDFNLIQWNMSAEIKEDLKEHIRSHGASWAPETRVKYTPLLNLWLDPHRGLKALLNRVLVYPRAKGRGCQARNWSKSWRPYYKSHRHCFKNQRQRNCDEQPSQHGSTVSKNELTMDRGQGKSQGSQEHCKHVQVQDPKANGLSQSPCLDSWLAQFLEGEEPVGADQSAEIEFGGWWVNKSPQPGAGAKAKRLWLSLPADSVRTHEQYSALAVAMPEAAPDPICQHTKWVDWWVKQMWDPPVWWAEMVAMPWRDGENPQLLAKYVAAACELPQVHFAQDGESHWTQPPCFSAFKHYEHMFKQDTSFTSMDICMKRRDKMLAFAWSL